jgi:peptide/nickel transport system substrate-binding protein
MDRQITTVVFTDIARSTELATRLGDAQWEQVLQRQRSYVRAHLRRFEGREIDTAGDGFLVTFGVPARAVAFALAVVSGAPELGIEIRAGVHTGEVEQSGSGVSGITVHIGARIAAAAEPGSVLVSGTVRDLAAGSDTRFEDAGETELRGVPGTWHLFRAIAPEPGLDLDAASGAQRAESAVRDAERQAGIVRGWRRIVATRRGRALTLGATAALLAVIGWVGWSVQSAPRLLASVPPHSVAQIDPSAGGIAAAASLGSLPDGIVVGEDAIWVTDPTDKTLTAIDARSLQVTDRLNVGGAPGAVAWGDGAVWVADSADRTVARIDPATGSVVGRYVVGNGPGAIAVDDEWAWATSRLDGTLSRIDLQTGDVLTNAIGVTPTGVAVAAGDVWVADLDTATVIRVDPSSVLPVGRVGVGNGPTAITAADGIVWVANVRDGTVSRIDPTTDTAWTVPVGAAPSAIAASSDAVWVGDSATAEVVRLDPSSGQVVQRISVGSSPQGIAIGSGAPWFTVRGDVTNHRGGTLRIALESSAVLPGIDPNAVTDPLAYQLLRLSHDSLVAYQHVAGLEGFTLVADLATAIPKPGPDDRTWTFQLRTGIHFSDGRPVRASDVRRSVERAVALSGPYGFTDLVGVDACASDPPVCDLSAGIEVDDESGRVTLHLDQPDADLLDALTFVFIVPADTPMEVATAPVPATGPYVIDRYDPDAGIHLVRNERFVQWSSAAQPDGYPDAVDWFIVAPGEDPIEMVASGAADWSPGALRDGGRIESLRTGHASQLHVFPSPRTWFEFMNTRVPPFDREDVRRAVNLATDRQLALDAYGGPLTGRITCQTLLPGLPGYEPYCPYTVGPGASGTWRAPDLSRAQAIIDASGTKGMTIEVLGADLPGHRDVAAYFASLLEQLGYQAHVRLFELWPYFDFVSDPANRDAIQMAGYWFQLAGTSLSAQFLGSFACDATFTADDPQNTARFCDPAIDARVQDAIAAEATDPVAARRIWAEVDRMVTDASPAVAAFNPTAVEFVSERVGNLQYHPILLLMLDQLWVR